MSLLSMLWHCTFQMGLIIYVNLLMLIQKSCVGRFILKTMPSCPGLTPMQHFTVSLTAGSVEHSPHHQWKASHGGHLHFKEILSQACEHLQQQSYVMPLLHLKTSNNTKMDRCKTLYFYYGYNVTFNFDYTLSQFNDEFATYKENRSISNGFLPDVYQMWNEVIGLTPEIGCLISTAPIFWEQIEPSPEVSQQIKYSDWKHLGFLPQEICDIIIPLFSNVNSGPTFVCPGSDWDWISVTLACSSQDLLDLWLLPMGLASPW